MFKKVDSMQNRKGPGRADYFADVQGHNDDGWLWDVRQKAQLWQFPPLRTWEFRQHNSSVILHPGERGRGQGLASGRRWFAGVRKDGSVATQASPPQRALLQSQGKARHLSLVETGRM